MHNSKLLQILSTLSDKEFKDFDTYLLAQTDKNSMVYLFFELIKKEIPNFESTQLSKENIHKKLYKGEAYKDVRIRELMSLLSKHVESFLIVLEQTSDVFYNELALLKQLRKRKLDNLYQSQIKSIEKILEADTYNNPEKHKRHFLLADELNNHFEQQQIRENNNALRTKSEFFDKYYFSNKLKNLSEMLNRENILNAPYAKTLNNEIQDIIKNHQNNYLDVPAVHCYSAIIKLLLSDNDLQQFENTFNTINKYQKSFPERELKTNYNYLLNYCIRHVNKGSNEFTIKLFELQKLLLQNKILLDNGEISHISFRNIVSIANKLKEYTWTEKFIEEFKPFITEKYRENAYNLSKSNLLYAQENYSDTIGLLNQVEFTDVYYACTAKFTQLKAYYALQEIETLDYFVSAFQLYLKRNKEISDSFKRSSENFIKHFKKLILIVKQLDYKENDKIEKKKKDLEKAIIEEKVLANKSWLLEELDKITL